MDGSLFVIVLMGIFTLLVDGGDRRSVIGYTCSGWSCKIKGVGISCDGRDDNFDL